MRWGLTVDVQRVEDAADVGVLPVGLHAVDVRDVLVGPGGIGFAIRASALVGFVCGVLERLLGILLGLVALPGLAYGEDGRADQPRDQREHDGSHAAHQRLVPSGELAELVQRRRPPGPDRLVPQVSTDVRGQLRRRRVAPRPVLLQCPGHDRLHVAAQVRVEPAEPRRLLLADHPRRLRHGQVLQGVGKPVRQQFKEHHPQHVDIRALV